MSIFHEAPTNFTSPKVEEALSELYALQADNTIPEQTRRKLAEIREVFIELNTAHEKALLYIQGNGDPVKDECIVR